MCLALTAGPLGPRSPFSQVHFGERGHCWNTHTHTALVTALISVLNECGETNTYHFIGYLSLEGNKSDKGEFTRKNAQGGRHFQHINCGIYWSQTSKIN